jgi:hypothetical protein
VGHSTVQTPRAYHCTCRAYCMIHRVGNQDQIRSDQIRESVTQAKSNYRVRTKMVREWGLAVWTYLSSSADKVVSPRRPSATIRPGLLKLILQLFCFICLCTQSILMMISVTTTLIGECLPTLTYLHLAGQYWTDFLEHVAWPLMWIEKTAPHTPLLVAIEIE